MKLLTTIVIFWIFVLQIVAKDSITLYVFLLDECKICQEATVELNELHNIYGNKVGFLGVFPNFASKRIQIEAFKKKYKVIFRTQTDYSKSLVKNFKATTLPEVVLYNETKKQIIYRGLIDDRYILPNKRRYNVQNKYLRAALDHFLSNSPISIKQTTPVGCVIEKEITF